MSASNFKRVSARVTLSLLLIALLFATASGAPRGSGRRNRDRLSKQAQQDRGVSDEEMLLITEEQERLNQEQAQQAKLEAAQSVGMQAPPPIFDIEEEALMKQWEKDMENFVAERMYTVELRGKSDEVFCHDISESEAGSQIRGIYYTAQDGDKRQTIDFFILDSERRVVYSRRKKPEGAFLFNATVPGQYLFIFSNLKNRVDKTLTVAFEFKNASQLKDFQDQRQQQSEEVEKVQEQVQFDEDYLRDMQIAELVSQYQMIQMSLTSMQSEQRMSNQRQDWSNQSIEGNNKYAWWISAAELVFFVGLAGFQVWYVMNMLENKRLLL